MKIEEAGEDSESLESIGKEILIFTRKMFKKKLVIRIHWGIYLIVNFIIILIESTSNLTEDPWWPWMTAGWGFGVLIHTYFYITRGMKSWFHFHVFFYLTLASFLIFIDGYSDKSFEWCWIPISIWAVFLIIHKFIGLRGTVLQEEVLIYAILISDLNGKTLVKVEQEPEFLKNHLKMDESSVELIPMLINSILQFSKEINMLDCNDFRLQNAEMKVITFAESELICTGFISSKSVTSAAQIVLKDVLTQFKSRFPREIKSFIKLGIEGPFDQYRSEIQKIMQDAVLST